MAQHDFVPAWLNFSTPQSTKVTLIQITFSDSYDKNKTQKISHVLLNLKCLILTSFVFFKDFWKLTKVKIIFLVFVSTNVSLLFQRRNSLCVQTWK